LSPEYTEKLQQLQKAIDALPLNTRDSLLASIRKNPERWKQGSIEDQLKVVELIRKSNTLLASLFNPTPFTDPEKTEIIQNLQSLNPEEFEAIEMLLDSKSVKEMIDRLQVDYPSVTLVLNADLQKLIEEEVKRRKSPPEKENKIGLGEIYDRYITELKKDFPTLGLVHQGGHFDRIQATDKSKNKTISFYLQKDGMVFIGNDPIQVSDAEGQIPPGPKAGSQAFKADSIEGYKKAIKEYVYEGKSPTEKQPSPPPEEKSESQEVSDTIKKKVLDRLKITDQVVKEIGMKVFCEKKGDLTEYYLTNNQTPFVLGYVYIDNNNKITKSSLRDDLLEAALDLKQFKDGINLLASGKKIENIVMRGVVEKFLSFYLQKSIKFNDDSLQISVKKNGDNLLIKAENNIVGHNDYREIRYDIATGTMQDYYDSETEK
jgi:hypothetical protein